jgi:hypothetical protein
MKDQRRAEALRDATPHAAPLRSAPYRIASQRAFGHHHKTSTIAPLRCAAPRPATHRITAHRCAPFRSAAPRFATQRPSTERICPVPSFEKNAAKAAALQKLIDHVQERIDANADKLIFVEVEQATGIPMRVHPVDGIRGRDLLRKAMKRCGRLWTPINSVGVTLSTAERAPDMVRRIEQVVVDGLVRAGDKVRILSDSHLHETTASQRDEFTRASARVSTLAMLSGGPRSAPMKKLGPGNGEADGTT